ncbi:hypothetical protein ABTX80_19245 [Streptomyces erythrochromogenes]|uniref:hypothetical protein n=1 Tax=Streptomyces erythrochromogenes TaxID=285574 RepID=UPI00332ADFB4
MITLRSSRLCLDCLPRPVPADPGLSEHLLSLFHFWHQTQGEAFTSATVRALGRISAAAAELVPLEHPECPTCRRAWATPFACILLDLAEELRHCICWPDRSAMRSALTARNAAIEGDRVEVDTFSRLWLRLDRPASWRPAVEMALLGNWVSTLGDGTADTHALIGRLVPRVQAEHRDLQPLWDRKVRGARTILLGSPVGDGLVLGDLLVTSTTPEHVVLAEEFTDLRIPAVLRQLRPSERLVALHWARPGSTSWSEAAARVIALDADRLRGTAPFALGERVRRKLKRLGARHTERTSAGSGTAR